MSPKHVPEKIPWYGKVVSVQPRIRLIRSFDERQHSYLGFAIRARGEIGDEDREFVVGIGKAAQAKNEFRRGDVVQGRSMQVPPRVVEAVEYYKTDSLEVVERSARTDVVPPPWHGVPPDLPTYRARGHRRLSARTYASRCTSCIWGCEMAVDIILDHWNPDRRRRRLETFCYGPKSCELYRPGPTRKVPGRKSHMVYVEEDWVDEEETAHRGPDE